MAFERAIYRLVGMDGHPHPVLDTNYETIDAAIGAAREWKSARGRDFGSTEKNRSIGIEVKTSNGSWRTISYS